MALPSKLPLDEVFRDARNAWIELKRVADAHAVLFNANANAALVLGLLPQLKHYRDRLVMARDTPGIGPFVQDMIVNPTYNVGADFNAMMTALDDVAAWVLANFPKDANGYLLRETLAPDGTLVDRMLTKTQLAPLKLRLETLSATIE